MDNRPDKMTFLLISNILQAKLLYFFPPGQASQEVKGWRMREVDHNAKRDAKASLFLLFR